MSISGPLTLCRASFKSRACESETNQNVKLGPTVHLPPQKTEAVWGRVFLRF